MAYYSSSVDNAGNEIASRFSARSDVSTLCSGRLSERTEVCTQRSGRLSTRSNLSTLRSASPQDDDRSRQDHRAMDNRFVNQCGAYVDRSLDYEDPYSMDSAMNMTERQSTNNIVPPLDLDSEDGYLTRREDCTFSYRKVVVPSDKKDPMVAYNSWLSAKRKAKTEDAMRRKKIAEDKIRQQEERKAKAGTEYQRWLERKAARTEAAEAAAAMEQQARHRAAKARRAAPAPAPAPTPPPKAERGYDPEAKEARLLQWDRKKRQQEEQQRLLKKQAEEKQRQLEEQRKRLSANAWEKWAVGAANRPKPVPLNQGFFTLRGTVSKIFVNPNEWQDIVPKENAK